MSNHNDARNRNLHVGFVSPAWPPDRAANGIVSYVGSMVEALSRCGDRTSVFALDLEASVGRQPNCVDVFGGPTASLDLLMRLRLRALEHLRPNDALALRTGTLITRALYDRSIVSGIDVIELEESFGIAEHVHCDGTAKVVRLHGPWSLNGPALGVPQNQAFENRCAAERRGIASAHAVSSPSQHILDAASEHMVGLAVPRAVIPNPGPIVAPEARWDPQQCDPNTLLFVGRFDRIKGADVLIQAFRRLTDKWPALKLLFVGPDPGLIEPSGKSIHVLEYLKRELPDSCAGRVTVTGRLRPEQIAALRRQAAMTIVASRQENFSVAVLEALSYGTPLIATRAGGIPEQVRDNETGLLFESESSADLARKIDALLEAPHTAATLAKRALEFAVRFHPDSVARTTRDFYVEAIEFSSWKSSQQT